MTSSKKPLNTSSAVDVLARNGAAQSAVTLAAAEDTTVNPRAESLIEYPSLFPIKVMGGHTETFVHEVTAIARQFDPFYDASTVELRPSKGGKYLGVTITITATSREQLDNLYRALTSHPSVKIVL